MCSGFCKICRLCTGIAMVPESKIFLGGVEDGGAVEGGESRRESM